MTTALSYANRFAFPCPVFGATVQLAGCMVLAGLHQVRDAGRRRPGCQACLSSERCPTRTIVLEVRRGHEPDRYFSAEPVVGELEHDTLEACRRILVQRSHVDEADPTPAEREAIERANAAACEPPTDPGAIARGGKPRRKART